MTDVKHTKQRLSGLGRMALLGMALLGLGLLAPEDWEAPETPAVAFDLRALDGSRLRSQDLVGKVALVDFWASWCGPCIRELPELALLHARLAGRKDAVLLSFNVTEEEADVRAFLDKRPLPYPVYLADTLTGPFQLVQFPTKVVIDFRKDPGVVRYRKEGPASVEEFEARLKDVLASPAN